MNIINLENITKYYGDKDLLTGASIGINDRDKVGIVGVNGTGKSTLLKIIYGNEEPDGGKVTRANYIHMGFLHQHFDSCEHKKIIDYVTDGSREPSFIAEAKKILYTLGITDENKNLCELSGGQKRRISLARTLIIPSDVLLLDEPTNHLDSEMIEWLESYLKDYKGCIILVTHDRYFLDNVCNRIVEIDKGRIYSYDSDYEGFLELKCQRQDMELASDDKRKNLLRNELKWVMRGAKARSTKQKARLERFRELKNAKSPEKQDVVEMESTASRLGKKTVELHDISFSYGEQEIIRNFDYTFVRNDRVGILGGNGCGKSTLIKIIAGVLKPQKGDVSVGETVRIGYLSQEPESISKEIRVIDSVKDIAEYISTPSGHITASKMCERFLFDSALQYAKVGKLSGGELRRLYLLHVLMSAPNVLILDEPTNDLDIETLNVLEDYLDHFSGIIIAVSHDRYFLDRIVNRIFAFEPDGIRQYEGGYTDYYIKHREIYGLPSEYSENEKKEISKDKSDREKGEKKNWKKPDTRLKFTYKEQREYDTIDEDIEKLEKRIKELEELIIKFSTDFIKLNEYSEEKEKKERELEEKMERWVYLTDLAERISNQDNK